MLPHFLFMTTATAAIILFTLLPFLPGRYDALAAPLSGMSYFFGRAGLLLVPIGALWVASRYSTRFAGRQHLFALAALFVSSIVWLAVSLPAFMVDSMLLGLGVLAFGAYLIFRAARWVRVLKQSPSRPASPIAFYLVIVPVAVFLLQTALIGPVTEFSRSRAIRNSSPLIAEIERYRAARGRYPPSLLAVWNDYWPSVIGIKEFRYEPSGDDSYNLFFEQFSLRLGTREFVMYNPRDQQAMTSHAMDVLQLSAEELQLDQRRGFNEVHDTPHPHWKYFWFD
ncbi:MAG: hypothetical protein M3365_11520 [Gemmatimonadota bacterium]|nr:hypothetical protein [Gemmatimonadota bacterium]